jgi:hypothetical protein
VESTDNLVSPCNGRSENRECSTHSEFTRSVKERGSVAIQVSQLSCDRLKPGDVLG